MKFLTAVKSPIGTDFWTANNKSSWPPTGAFMARSQLKIRTVHCELVGLFTTGPGPGPNKEGWKGASGLFTTDLKLGSDGDITATCLSLPHVSLHGISINTSHGIMHVCARERRADLHEKVRESRGWRGGYFVRSLVGPHRPDFGYGFNIYRIIIIISRRGCGRCMSRTEAQLPFVRLWASVDCKHAQVLIVRAPCVGYAEETREREREMPGQ